MGFYVFAVRTRQTKGNKKRNTERVATRKI